VISNTFTTIQHACYKRNERSLKRRIDFSRRAFVCQLQ
jgi:hypothetical protein